MISGRSQVEAFCGARLTSAPSCSASRAPSSCASRTSTCVRVVPPPRGKSISSGALSKLVLTTAFSGSSSALRFRSAGPPAPADVLFGPAALDPVLAAPAGLRSEAVRPAAADLS